VYNLAGYTCTEMRNLLQLLLMQDGLNTHTKIIIMHYLVCFKNETNKLLYIGVQNKFCSVCTQGSSKEYKCFRNCVGLSYSMESDIYTIRRLSLG